MRSGLFILTAALCAFFVASSAMAIVPITYVGEWTDVGDIIRGMDCDVSGNLYVSDHGTKVVKFTPDGTMTTFASVNSTQPSGSLVDNSVVTSGTATSNVYSLDATGAMITSWSHPDMSMGIDTDISGNVYLGVSEGRVFKYDSTGILLEEYDGLNGSYSGGDSFACGLALSVDATTAYWIDCNGDGGDGTHAQLEALDLATDTSTVLADLMMTVGHRGAVAINRNTGNIYVSARDDNVVQEFSSDGVLP